MVNASDEVHLRDDHCHHRSTYKVNGHHGSIHCSDLVDTQSWRIEVAVNKIVDFEIIRFNGLPCDECSNECDSIEIFDLSNNTLILLVCSGMKGQYKATSLSNSTVIKYTPGTAEFPRDTTIKRHGFVLSFQGLIIVDFIGIHFYFLFFFFIDRVIDRYKYSQQVSKEETESYVTAKRIAVGVAIGTGVLVVFAIIIGFYCAYYRKKSEVVRRRQSRNIDSFQSRATQEELAKFYPLQRITEVSTDTLDAVLEPQIQEVVRPERSMSKVSTISTIANDQVFTKAAQHVEIDPSQLDIDDSEPIGIGSFGVLYFGYYHPHKRASTPGERDSKSIRVVVKKMRVVDENYLQVLQGELKLLNYLGSHPHIVQLIGGITKPEVDFSVVVEYCDFGSLKQFISNFNAVEQSFNVTEIKPPSLSVGDLLLWSEQIANGMHYLHFKNAVHRDLAARNVLLTSEKTVKLTDFGIARTINLENFFMGNNDSEHPWKWCAPEVLNGEMFEPNSDIWSYGVLMWEMFSLGQKPYPNALSCTKEFVEKLEKGDRLPRISTLPNSVYSLMLLCWQRDPNSRPSFATIEQTLLGLRTRTSNISRSTSHVD